MSGQTCKRCSKILPFGGHVCRQCYCNIPRWRRCAVRLPIGDGYFKWIDSMKRTR